MSTENKINTRIVPMLLELGYKDNREEENKNLFKIFVNDGFNWFSDTQTSGAIKVGDYTFDGSWIWDEEIQFDGIKKCDPELLPVFKEIQKIIDEENGNEN